MESLVHTMLNNALLATGLAIVLASLSRVCRRPAVIHCLRLLAMIKLVTPPLVPVSVPVAGGILPVESQASPASSGPDALTACGEPIAADTIAAEPITTAFDFDTEPTAADRAAADRDRSTDTARIVDPSPPAPNTALVPPF